MSKKSELLWDIKEKIDKGRYKLGLVQELFSVAPGCDGYSEPKDTVLFYLGMKTILQEIADENTNASDELSDLCHAESSKGKEVTA
jgi:hypothetical protein